MSTPDEEQLSCRSSVNEAEHLADTLKKVESGSTFTFAVFFIVSEDINYRKNAKLELLQLADLQHKAK